MNKSARNERRKLTATGLNGGAIAALAVGCCAPITGYATSASTISPVVLVPLVCGWSLVSSIRHRIGRWMMGGVED